MSVLTLPCATARDTDQAHDATPEARTLASQVDILTQQGSSEAVTITDETATSLPALTAGLRNVASLGLISSVGRRSTGDSTDSLTARQTRVSTETIREEHSGDGTEPLSGSLRSKRSRHSIRQRGFQGTIASIGRNRMLTILALSANLLHVNSLRGLTTPPVFAQRDWRDEPSHVDYATFVQDLDRYAPR